MKKSFKIIGIIVVIVLVIIGLSLGYSFISKSIRENERRNAKTLMEYVKLHDSEHLDCDSSDCLTMSIEYENFKCDVLNNTKVKEDLYNRYFVTEDNSVYIYSFENLYSNDQNCKKIELESDTEIKGIKGEYAIGKDNQIYYFKTLENGLELEKYNHNTVDESAKKKTLTREDIKKIVYVDSDYNKKEVYITVLKNDNNLYKLTYKMNNSYTDVSLIKDELFEKLDKYGEIVDIEYSTYYTNNSGWEYDIDEPTVTYIISDKGYFYLSEIETEECTKYQDVDCEVEIKESEMYKKYSKDIKQIFNNYTVLSDNSVIRTNYLTYALDKDLK